MTAKISPEQGQDIFGRLVKILCNGDTWRGRAFEMRVVFDLMLNYANKGEVATNGGFWEAAINNMFADDKDRDSLEELNEIRLWFNELQHPLKGSDRKRRYRGYNRATASKS